ncbi:MAG: hypothetical protein NT069_25155, partial [Planctomycetota bacterium]|nr:hypothetical protein [Planctomycetota bacterium]
IGYADALLARELPDGRLQLIDGHLRAETTPKALVPVLVLDLTEAEADKLLVTLDPLAALAGVDSEELDTLLDSVQFDRSEVIDALAGEWERAVDDLQRDPPPPETATAPPAVQSPPSDALPSRYCVLIDCENEAQQLTLLERFAAEGLSCRALIA